MKLTKRERIYLITALLTVYMYVFVSCFFKPIIEKISNIKYNILMCTREYDIFSNMNMKKMHDNYETFKANYEKCLNSIPDIKDSYRIFDDIFYSLTRAGVKIDEIYCDDKKTEEKLESENKLYIQTIGTRVKFNGATDRVLEALNIIENSGILKGINEIYLNFNNDDTINAEAEIEGMFLSN